MFMCVVLCICLSLCLCIFATVCQWHCRETSGYLHICQMRFPAAAPPGNLATAFCFQTIRSTVTLNFSKLNNCNWWGKLNCELLLHYCELVLHHCELLLHHCELVLHYCELVVHQCELLLHHCELYGGNPVHSVRVREQGMVILSGPSGRWGRGAHWREVGWGAT